MNPDRSKSASKYMHTDQYNELGILLSITTNRRNLSKETLQLAKRANETAKKSPLKVVSPIIKKYTGHRQGKIKKKLKFPRILHGGRTKQKKQIKPQLKTILPKTNAGDVIVLEPELFPCALNPQKKLKDENEQGNEQGTNHQGAGWKASENSSAKDSDCKTIKTKLLPSNKKKIKCLKNIKASLELLESNASSLKEKREQAFAENYLLKVQQRLKGADENIYEQFLDLMCSFQANGFSVCELFKKIKSLFHSHIDLCEDFVAFLTPEQAVECGVFMDHLLLTTMSDFLSMIEIYFSKSPQQIRKIDSVLESLVTKSNVTTECITNSVLPLLKGNPVLRDYFLQLLPGARPPDHLLTDFEEVEYPELNSDVSDDEEMYETVHLPDIEDPYGGDLCPCKCHDREDEKFKIRGEHCMSCSLKFINGKIFIQQGKLLKPARVIFADNDVNYHRERLAPKLYPKRNQKRHRHLLFKDNVSPTKSCNLSSDEFKSDIEEEEKGRLKLASLKSFRLSRKKSVSPKHCDKTIPRCSSNDSKPDVESGGKPAFSKWLNFSLKEEKKASNEEKMAVDEKGEQCDFLTFSCDAKPKQVSASPCSLHLPEIETENSTGPSSMILLNKSPKNEGNEVSKSDNSMFVNKEGSHSPPVISIPETATPLFSEAKPILSFLEKLDDSKDYLAGPEGKIINLEEPITEKEMKLEKSKTEENPWKIEEDRIILQTLQVEENCEQTFVKIGKNIPARSVQDIKKRFEELMNMLYEMKAKTCKAE